MCNPLHWALLCLFFNLYVIIFYIFFYINPQKLQRYIRRIARDNSEESVYYIFVVYRVVPSPIADDAIYSIQFEGNSSL
jgi:hypothetical protein